MKEFKPQQLIGKYLDGKCSEEEKAALDTWYLSLTENRTDNLTEPGYEQLEAEMWNVIEKAAHPHQQTKPLKLVQYNRIRYVAAAIVLCILGVGIFLYFKQHQMATVEVTGFANDIKPGRDRAYLTLADGKRIDLSGASAGQLAEQAGIVVEKSADGQLVYTVADQKLASVQQFNTIETPRGGKYQLNLPDGTRIWLNSASSLKYPVSFAHLKERKVELSGEGYFEVAKNKDQPFRVISGKQEVEVLGTHFNINSYGDEPTIRTTLLEGSVKVSSQGSLGAKVIKPGQQASSDGSSITVAQADIEADTDWKNGDFIFRDENIQSVMRKISRWYDVEVIYDGDIGQSSFGGSISRSKNIAAVLHVLEETGGVHFKLQGRRITVMK